MGNLVAGRLRSARTGLRTSCVFPKPDKAIQIGSGSVLHTMIRALFKKEKKEKEPNRTREVGSGIYDPARFCLHVGRNGRNQNASGSDPACLLGCFCLQARNII